LIVRRRSLCIGNFSPFFNFLQMFVSAITAPFSLFSVTRDHWTPVHIRCIQTPYFLLTHRFCPRNWKVNAFLKYFYFLHTLFQWP
jgi:hypothetical protein